MAQKVYTESVVTLNAQQAELTLNALKKQAKEYEDAMKAAKAVGDYKGAEKMEKQLRATEGVIRKVKKETYDYSQILKNINGSSLNQLERASKTLYIRMKSLVKGTKEYAQTEKDLAKVNVRIKELKKDMASMAKNNPNKLLDLTIWSQVLKRAGNVIKDAANEAARLDDVMSDVMKTTGLTHEEVERLNKAFVKMDTRTSREALNNLARDAGKLGITGSDNLLQFVRAADQINVALGEDLGEGAIRDIGKIADVFGLTKSMGIEKSLLSIGSAINALGQDSTANEAYLVDFTQRLAGVGAQAGISVQNIMGFASGLDQSAMKVEMAATAFQKFVMNMYSDTATFAGYAGMEVEKFSQLLESDANTAIITVLKSLQDKDGFQALVPIFKGMGADGARAVSVLSSMASNIDAVTSAQKLSNEEFTKATSLTDEFNVKNNNLQAQLDKAKKRLNDSAITLGEKFVPWLIKGTEALSSFSVFASKNIKIVLSLAAGILILVLRQKMLAAQQIILNNATAIWAGIAKAGKIASLSLSLAYAKLTGNTSAAAKAMAALQALTSIAPWKIYAAAIAAVAGAVYLLTGRSRESKKAMREFRVETGKLKLEAGSLFDILQNNTEGTDLYKNALEKLKELYGPYISHLIDEKGYLTDIEAARSLVNDQIERSIAVKYKEQVLSGMTEKRLEKESKYYDDINWAIKKTMDVGEEAANLLTAQALEMLKNGSTTKQVWDELFSSINSWNPLSDELWYKLSAFAASYRKYVDDFEKTSKKFDSFLPKAKVSIDGPVGPTLEDLKRLGEEKRKIREDEAKKSKEELDKEFKSKEEKLEFQEKTEMTILKRNLANHIITQEEYNAKSSSIQIEYLMKRNALQIQYGKDNSDTESKLYDKMISIQEETHKKMEAEAKAFAERMKEYDTSALAFQEADAAEDDPGLDAVISAFWEKEKMLEDLRKEAEAIREKNQEKSWKRQRDLEMENLRKMHEEKLLSEKDYAQAVKDVRIQSAEGIISVVSSYINTVSNLFNAMRDMEYERLNSEKERELAMYGDTADKRAEIENKYEQRKLEIQKEYADTDMGLKIAQTIAAGALAVVQAFGQLGPIGGAIAAVLIAATTAASIATIVAQRNAIQNASASGSSGSGSSVGVRTVNGYYEGGYTPGADSDHTEVGVVHANEWVAPAAMVRAKPTVFASLERERAKFVSSSGAAKGYYDGGYGSSSGRPAGGNGGMETATMAAIISREVAAQLSKSPIKAYTLLSDSNAAQEVSNKFKKATSRR